MKNVHKGKCFADVEEVKQKTAEALKDIKMDEFKHCFEQWKKVSTDVLYQMESTLKVTEIEHVKYTFFFINKFQFFGSSLVQTC